MMRGSNRLGFSSEESSLTLLLLPMAIRHVVDDLVKRLGLEEWVAKFFLDSSLELELVSSPLVHS